MPHLGKALIFISGAFAVFIGAVYAVTSLPSDDRTAAEKISINCKREFGHLGAAAEADCVTSVLLRWARGRDRDALDRVYRSSY